MKTCIAEFDESVEASVTSERIVCARNVVANRGRKKYHGDLERLVLISGLLQLTQCYEGLETTDNDKCLDVVPFKNKGDFFDIFRRQCSVARRVRRNLQISKNIVLRSDLRTTFADP